MGPQSYFYKKNPYQTHTSNFFKKPIPLIKMMLPYKGFNHNGPLNM